jgi:endonuclease YncB( thermonuclease family)
VPVAPVRANYIGAFPVIDASSFQSVCKVVGDRVELVGQIVELKHGTSRKRTPYLFINFGHWRDDCVRLTVWSEGLQSLGFTPDASWKGKWVSVTGMVDPVYNGTNRYKTISYRSVGITIAEHSQLREISRDEAAWRLGKTTRPQGMGANAIRQGAPQQSVPQKNQEIIDQLKKGTKPPPYPPASAPISPRQRPRTPLSTTITSNPSGVKARNEQLLKSVQQASPTPSPPRLPQTKPPAPIGKGCAIVVALLAALLIYGQQFGSSSSLPSAGSIPTTSQLSKAHLTGKVTAIADGDTITVLDSNRVQHKIRLDGIDAPESGQPFGTQAKKAISDKVFGREVNVVTTGQDRYGRTLGHVYLGNRWINRELVEEGWAWHYVQYSRDA